MNNIQELSHLAWLTSLKNKNAGRWITAYPKTKEFTFSNAEYTTAFCYRFYLDQPSVHLGTRCNCAARSVIDSRGHHLITKCGKEGLRHENHDVIRDTILRLARMNGIRCRKEDNTMFHAVHPNNNLRTDVIFPEQEFTAEVALLTDVQITAPTACGITTRVAATTPGRSANASATMKRNKYGEIARLNGHEFTPLIFESTGYIHPDTVDLVKKMVSYGAAAMHRDVDMSNRYALTMLNVTLMKRLAATLLKRTAKLNGNPHVVSRASAYHLENMAQYEEIHYRMNHAA